MSADDSVQGCDQEALFSHRVFTAVTAEHNFGVAIYKIFEQCLLLDSSSPRILFRSILGAVIVDFISGMSSLISAVPTCQCFILREPSRVRPVKIVTRSENLGSIRGGLSGHQPEVKKVADMLALRKRFEAQHIKKMGKMKDCWGFVSAGYLRGHLWSIKVMCFSESDHVKDQKEKEQSCDSLDRTSGRACFMS